MRKQIDVPSAVISFADETKVHGQSVKSRMEEILNKEAKAFYQECADKEGIPLSEWLESANKGEF